MDVRRQLRENKNLTPTEAQLARTVLDMGERIQDTSIKELARASATSIATVHRLCKKLGLEGYKELKVALARAAERDRDAGEVNFDFPFDADWGADRVATSLQTLYASAIEQTREVLDSDQLTRAAALLGAAREVDVYTESHNLYPAQMFVDRLLSVGRLATCHESQERKVRTALSSDKDHVAIYISYSGVTMFSREILPILSRREVPVILIGTAAAQRRNPGLDAYLLVGDSESTKHRITQFASHISVQYVLDVLYGCVVSADYEASMSFIRQTVPYVQKPGLGE